MYFPTVIFLESPYRHAIKNLNNSECGIKFDISRTGSKGLKKIKFKQIENITCPTCKSIIEMSIKISE